MSEKSYDKCTLVSHNAKELGECGSVTRYGDSLAEAIANAIDCHFSVNKLSTVAKMVCLLAEYNDGDLKDLYESMDQDDIEIAHATKMFVAAAYELDDLYVNRLDKMMQRLTELRKQKCAEQCDGD